MKKIGLLILTLCLAAGVPAFADETINIANPSAGTGWTFSNNVVTITANGNYTVTGTTSANRIVIDKNVTATVTLNNANIHSADASPFSLSSDDTGGSDVTLILEGKNELVATGARVVCLQVENNARLTIEGAGSLVVVSPGGQDDPAAIGGSGNSNAGTVNITGGTVYASGGSGPGIGAGAGHTGGVINITGGAVIADEIGMGNTRTETHISGANTIVLSPSINTTTFGGAQVLTGTNIGISCSVSSESMNYKVTLYADLTIPSGCTLTVPAGIVFDVNHKRLTVNGELVRQGQVINEDYIPPVRDINLTGIGRVDGDGWISRDNVVTITASGDRIITGSSDVVSVVIEKDVTAVITLDNVRIHSTASPISLSSDNTSGSDVTLILEGNNELVTTGARAAGLQVASNARLTIEGAGSLVAMTPGGAGDPAGIGGGGFSSTGTINISGGTVYASGGSGPGIGAGTSATGGVINITGGAVIADEIGMGNSRTETHISGANTIVLSPSINTTTFGGAQVLTGTNIGISCSVSSESMDYKVTLNEDLTIPSGCTLTVPAGIVFDVNHKRLTVNGELVRQGQVINEDYIPPVRDINLTGIGRVDGDGWISRDNVVTITASGDRTITGSSDVVSIVIEKDVTAVITLDNVRIHSSTASPISLSSDDTKGSDVTLILVGSNELVTTGARAAGLRVTSNARLTIEGAGSLIAMTPGAIGDPAGIGGGGFSSTGTINITGGTVYASGGTGPGIGAGASATGGVINITGGTVIADEIGMGNTRTETHISGANTIVLSPSINTTTFGGAQVLTGTNIGISCSVSSESMDYKVTLNEDLTIPSGATLIVQTGIVFDVNNKGLTNNGIIREYGSLLNKGSLTGNPAVGAIQPDWITTPAQTYTGDSLKPAVTVKSGDFTLAQGDYYTVTAYDNNLNAGTATVTITDLGDYHTVTQPFTIARRPVAAGFIQNIPAQPYTGDSLKPALVVRDGNRTLTLNTDYTVAYPVPAATNAGTYEVGITGMGNYSGSASVTFTIKPKALAAGSIQDIPAQPWTGDTIIPAVVVRDGSKELALNMDYTVAYTDNVNAGTATVAVTGMSNYSGTASVTFTIKPKALAARWMEALPAQTYTGDSLKPAVVVRDGSKTLTLNTDYTVAYTDNVNAETATVAVTGMGNYSGTASVTFTIKPKALAAGPIQDIPAQPWTGDSIKPAVVVRDGSKELALNMDYTVAYTDNVNAGLGMVRVIGKGNYTGNAYGYFNILPRQIATEWLEDVPPQVWTGEAIEPAVTVRDGDGTLTPGTDYKVTYANNVNVGPEAWVSVTGVGNYTGTKSKMFSIVSPQTDTVPTPPPADTVPKAVTGVSFYNDSYIVEKGKALQLFALFVPADAGNRNVSWATSNKAVATVSAGGKVTAVSAGEATITVTTEDGGYRDTCLIRVPGIVTTKDTVIYQKIIFYERDTLYRDTTVYRTDTLYTDTTVHRVDTLYRDTTLYLTDTLYRDTTVYRTDTLYNDTVIYVVNIVQVDSIDYNLVPDTIYVVIEAETGAELVVTVNARVSEEGSGILLEGLKPDKEFSIYTVAGAKYATGFADSAGEAYLTDMSEGLYILFFRDNDGKGQYSKFYHRKR